MFVLSNSQMNEAIVHGAGALGIINASEVDEFAKNINAMRIRRSSSGMIVVDLAESGLNTTPTAPAKPPTRPGRKPAATAAPQPANAAAPSQDEGPPPANVKAALIAAGMENPPGLNTIQAWDAAKRKQALKWAKDPTKPRPEFIVPRAARGSKQATSAAAPPSTPSTPSMPPAQTSNGVAASASAPDFFDQP